MRHKEEPMSRGSVGLLLGSEMPPERLRGMASDAEEQGFDELWLSEDCFFTGGISGACLALGATRRIPVGIGVVSAVTRHPAVLAMEIATLARAFPGRLRPAVGLGVPAWLEQMGLRPQSPLSAVRECVTALRTLLGGDRLDSAGGRFTYEGVRLTYPVPGGLPLLLGVAGPKMLQLSGEVADGTILSVLAGVDYVGWARDQIAIGAQRASRSVVDHEVTTFALCAVDEDSARARKAARAAVAFYLSAGGPNGLTSAYGISDALTAMLEAGGPAEVAQSMPDAWVDDLAIAGDPGECAAKIDRLFAAGSDHVALFSVPPEHAERTITLLATDVLPRLGARTPTATRPAGLDIWRESRRGEVAGHELGATGGVLQPGSVPLRPQRTERELERAGHEDGPIGVGQGEGLFWRQRVGLRLRVVLHVPPGRLAAQPFIDVTGGGAGALGELTGRHRPLGEHAIKAEPIADEHVARRHCRAEVSHEPVQEFHQPFLVDLHRSPSGERPAERSAGPRFVLWLIQRYGGRGRREIRGRY
jgi:alkanesulfonate monooxygenase SsuD/methylene tetrahydromethanopterin reductase-like flavin-dependent oxidoreductase (luciferase family)